MPWVEYDQEVKYRAGQLYYKIVTDLNLLPEKTRLAALNLSAGLERREWPFTAKEKGGSPEFWVIRDTKLLEREMKIAAKNLDFERAAQLRDLIKKNEI